MDALVAFFNARLDEDEMKAEDASSIQAGKSWRGWRYDLIGSGYEVGDEPVGAVKLAAVGHVARHDPERVFRDVAADRKLIARYVAAVESHEESVQALAAIVGGPVTVAGFGPASEQAAREDVAAAHGRVSALLAVIEDRAERFADHPDYLPEWKS